MLYSLSHVTKVYGARKVLDIDYIEIRDKDIYALLGPNGAGKTTLMKIFGFLDHPTSGQMHFRSKPVIFTESQLNPLRKKVVMVDQHPMLFSTTVFNNLEFGLKIRKIPKKERVKIIESSLELVNMQHMAKAQAHKLSGGETQRIALARALALAPDVILCDEPTSNVDLENQIAVIKLLKQINEEKKIAIIFTSHDKLYAASLAHHSIILDHGKPVTGIYENLFTGTVTDSRNGIANCKIQNKLDLPVHTDRRGMVRVFINPEKINLTQQPGKEAGNHYFSGEVIQIAKESSKIRVIIDVDVFITLLISPQQYKQWPVMVGENVRITIPQNAVKIL